LDNSIEGYLTQMKAALAGADPALVQDALFDAEEYLRDAIAEAGAGGATADAAFHAAVDAYGTPEEVAAAYRDAELTVGAALRTPAPAVTRSTNPVVRFFGILADPQAWGAIFYMLLAFVTGIIYFTIVVTGVSLSLGLAILIIGIPVALLTLGVVRAISFAEGRLVESLLGTRMPRRPRVVSGTATGERFLSRIKSWLTDWRTWTSMLYMVLQLPLGIIYFTVLVTGVSVSLALIAAPLLQQFATHGVFFTDGAYNYIIQPWSMPLMVIGGVLGLFVTMWIAKGIGHLHGLYAKALLVGKVDPSVAEQAAVYPAVPAPAAYAPRVPPTPPAQSVSSGADQGGVQ
jgi:hypothetical protein